MPATYGYIRRTEGADGDQVDVYVGPEPAAETVFIVDQVDADTKAFDEHKAFIGFPDQAAVERAYDAAFSDGKGPDRRRAVVPVPIESFKAWLKDGDTKKPAAESLDAGVTGTESAPTAAGTAPAAAPQVVVDDKKPGTKAKPQKAGPASRVITPSGRRIGVQPEVVEAEDLVTSHDEGGTINPAYPEALQPRDRSRVASQAWIVDTAANLDPERLMPMPMSGDGAPIVDATGNVESGNGRVLAIRRAYEQGQGEGYRGFLKGRGIDVDQFKAPVLVQRRTTKLKEGEKADYVEQSNVPTVAGRSVSEIAAADAGRLSADTLALYPGEPLTHATSREFVRRFVETVIPEANRSELMTADGDLSQQGIERIQNAVFARAYGDVELLGRLREETEGSVRTIGGALIEAGAIWSRLREAAAAGQINKALDVTDDLLAAVRMVETARRDHRSLAGAVRQINILEGGALSATGEKVLALLYRDPGLWSDPSGRARIVTGLTKYAGEALKGAAGRDMFGFEATPGPILEVAFDEQDRVHGAAGGTVRPPPEQDPADDEHFSMGRVRTVEPGRSPDDPDEVIDSNFLAGMVKGDESVPAADLTGGVRMDDSGDRRRVEALAREIEESGRIDRLVVDQDGNVLEGQHRLEAARRLGIAEIPITRVVDLETVAPLAAVEEAVTAAQPMRPEQARQLARHALEAVAEEGSVGAVERSYTAPRGHEAGWGAALRRIGAANPDMRASVKRVRTEPQLYPTAMKKADVEAVIAPIVGKWRRARAPKVNVVQSVSELPIHEKYRKYLAERFAAEGVAPRGIYRRNAGDVWLVADGLATAQQVRETLAHEAVGHFSVEQMLGSDWGRVRDDVLRLAKRDARVATVAAQVRRNYGDVTPDVFASEIIAHMAEQDIRRPALVRVVAAVRRFLRSLGLRLDFSEADVRDMIARAAGRLEGKDRRLRRAPKRARRDQPGGPEKPMEQQERFFSSLKAQTAERRFYPVDRLFRLLMAPIGGVNKAGEWRYAPAVRKRARKIIREARPDPNGPFAWADPFIETARSGWLNRYGTPEDFIRRERQAHTDKARIEAEGIAFVEAMVAEDMTAAEARALQELLEGQPSTDERLGRLAAPIREALDQYGNELVELGLLSKETFEKNKGAWLHRSYERYERDAPPLARWGRGVMAKRRQALLGDELKMRGKIHKIPKLRERIMRDVPDALKKTAQQSKFWRIYDRPRGKSGVDRVYWPANLALPARREFHKGGEWTDRGKWELMEASGRRPVLRQDYSKAERQEMGEIRDARFNVLKSFRLLAHDIAQGRLFEDMTQHPEWYSATKPEDIVIDAREAGAVSPYIGVGWVRVPDTLIGKSTVKRWGALAGGYVRASIWRDMVELDKMQRPGTWSWLMREYKLNKALAIDTPIPTPAGWTTMGALRVGDTVFDEKGQPCTVEEVKDVQHGRPCYEVAFSDGETIVADDEHWWFVIGRGKNNPNGKVLTTAEIRDTLELGGGQGWRHSVPAVPGLKPTRQIVGVTAVPSVPVRCIAVSSESHLYLAGAGMIPTHNTARSPGVHWNNTAGNVILADLHDLTVADFAAAVREWSSKGEHYREAVDHGIFHGGYARVELQNEEITSALDEAIRQTEAEIAKPTAMQMTWNFWKRVDKAARGAYQFEDEIFRLASFIRDRAQGDSAQDAAANAIDRFLNYDIRAPWPNMLRRSVLPFFSYSYAFVPVMLKAVVSRPWKLAKLFTLGYVLNMLAYEVTGGDEERERAVMAPRDRGLTWVALPRMMRMPFNGPNADPMYLDLGRVIPGGGMLETDIGQAGLPEFMLVGGPLAMAADLMWNRVAYSGEDVVNNEIDTMAEKAEKRAAYLWRASMPNLPFLPGTWTWKMLNQAISDERDIFGRQYSVPVAMVRAMGPKLKPQDPEYQHLMRMFDFRRERKELKRVAYQVSSDWRRRRISRERYEREIDQFQKRMKELDERVAELNRVFKGGGE